MVKALFLNFLQIYKKKSKWQAFYWNFFEKSTKFARK